MPGLDRPRAGDLLALATLALLALLFFWPVTFDLGWIPRGGGDLVSFLWPTYSYAAQALQAGRLPLWNHTLYSGAPFAADNQSGLFYPPNLLTFLLAPSLPYAAMEWLVIGHVWLAGASMYFLLRTLLPADPTATVRPTKWSFVLRPYASSLFSAVAYMFSDVFVTHVGNLNIVAVSAWLPAAFAALRLGLTRRSPGWAAGAGVVLGIAALAGHAQMMLIVAGALGLYALWHITWHVSPVMPHGPPVTPHGSPVTPHGSRITSHGSRITSHASHPAHRLQLLTLTVLTFAVAFGISAVSLIPAAEMTPYTARTRLDYAAASEYSLPWAGLAGLLSPLVFGRGASQFWGPWDRVELGYAGALTLLFAGLAAFTDRRGLPLFMGGLGVFGVLVALGENTPVHRLLYLTAPGFAQLRVPARFILLTDFSLAVLAGLGLQRLAQVPRRQLWIWGAAVLLAVLVTLLLAPRMPMPATTAIIAQQRLALQRFSLALVAGMILAGLALVTFRGRLGKLAPVLALGMLSADLIGHGAWVEVEQNDPTLEFPHPAVVEFLKSQPGPTRIDNASGAWSPDAAARHGLEDIGGIFNPLALAGYQTYLGAVGARGTPLYNFLNAQFVIADKGQPPGDTSLIPVFDEDPALDVYLNTKAMPRLGLAYSATMVPNGEAAFGAIHTPGFDPASIVVIEGTTAAQPFAVSRSGAAGTPGESNLYYLEYGPEAFSVVAVTPAPAYLVFSEVWYPGWRAWVDGGEVVVLRANFAFRAVYLRSPGEHTVEMRFDQLSWKVGLSITALTLVGLGMWGGVSVYHRGFKLNT